MDTLVDHCGHDLDVCQADALTLMVGGFHTSGNFMTFALHFLSLYPEVQEKVFSEVSKVLKEAGDELDEEGLKELVLVLIHYSTTHRLCR